MRHMLTWGGRAMWCSGGGGGRASVQPGGGRGDGDTAARAGAAAAGAFLSRLRGHCTPPLPCKMRLN
jgi:hypothetical protein